jgi:hypothetical protein
MVEGVISILLEGVGSGGVEEELCVDVSWKRSIRLTG